MTTYALIKTACNSMEEAALLVETLFGFKMEPHYSWYYGGYYRYCGSGEQNIAINVNEYPDGDLLESNVAVGVVIIYLNGLVDTRSAIDTLLKVPGITLERLEDFRLRTH